jgi:hypothetical protein
MCILLKRQSSKWRLPNSEISKSRGTRSGNGISFSDKTNSDIVVGTDPDCDRLGLLVRNNEGQMTLLSEKYDFNDCLLLEQWKKGKSMENSLWDLPCLYNDDGTGNQLLWNAKWDLVQWLLK